MMIGEEKGMIDAQNASELCGFSTTFSMIISDKMIGIVKIVEK